MPLTKPNAVRGLVTVRGRRPAVCWKLTRGDGVVLKFTNHDLKLAVGADEYTPIGSADPTARRREGATKEHNLDFRGVISSAAITHSDLRAGRYRDAQVDETLVDWRYPFASAIATWRYWIGNVSFDGEIWNAECSGLGRWLRQRVGDVFGRTCKWDLGVINVDGDGCPVDLPSLTVSGVHAIGFEDGEKRRILRCNTTELSGSYADGWFAEGKIVFTSGANSGLSGFIQSYTQATRRIELQVPMPFEISTADAFNVVPGCNKLWTTCKNKFAVALSFGGYPFIPGTDRILRIVAA